MNRAFVHLELNTDDIERARSFYKQVLGWSFNDVPIGDQTYLQIVTPRGPGAGVQAKPDPRMPNHWMPYVGVEDVRATVSRARRAGATIVTDYSPMPGFGALAIITGPDGATFGVWQIDTPDEEPAKSAPKKNAAKKKAAKKKTVKKKTVKKKAAKKKTVKKKTVKRKATASIETTPTETAPVETAVKPQTKKAAAKKKVTKKKAPAKKKRATKKKAPAKKKKTTKKKRATKKKAPAKKKSARPRGRR